MAILNMNYGGGGEEYTAGDGIDISDAVISATNTGKARVLTAEDYNWPENNPNGVALWKIGAGCYVPGDSVYVYFNSGNRVRETNVLYLVGNNTGDRCPILRIQDTPSNSYFYNTDVSSGVGLVYNLFVGVENILTSVNTKTALSANQGKVLKDLVDSLAIRGAGAPTTSTVGQVGTLYEDTTNGKLYICTDATNPYVWEEVGAGGGGSGVTELTAADYNYPTDNPTSVALWLLDPGIYTRSTADGVVVRYGLGANQTLNNNENTVLVTEPTASGSKSYLMLASNSIKMRIAHSESSGNAAESQIILNTGNVVHSVGSSQTDVMSQKAVSDAISAIGAGTRKASSTGWNTSNPLDYIAERSLAIPARGILFPVGDNLSDFPTYVGVGIDADDATPEPIPYLLVNTTSDDGRGTTSSVSATHRIALHSEIPTTFTTNEWDALWA